MCNHDSLHIKTLTTSPAFTHLCTHRSLYTDIFFLYSLDMCPHAHTHSVLGGCLSYHRCWRRRFSVRRLLLLRYNKFAFSINSILSLFAHSNSTERKNPSNYVVHTVCICTEGSSSLINYSNHSKKSFWCWYVSKAATFPLNSLSFPGSMLLYQFIDVSSNASPLILIAWKSVYLPTCGAYN